jgi:hypothetical protein
MRPLGSFNSTVNLPSHPEDIEKYVSLARGIPASGPRVYKSEGRWLSSPMDETQQGYETGIHRNALTTETGIVTDSSRGGARTGPATRRFAGQAMNIDLSPGVIPSDPGGYETSPAGTNEPAFSSGGRIQQPMNADIKAARPLNLAFTYQPIQGQAELRTS